MQRKAAIGLITLFVLIAGLLLWLARDKQDYPEKMFLLYPEISDIGNPPINLDFAINASESIPFLFKIKVPVPRKKNS